VEVIPAIDLRGGRVVRLRQGDFGRETDFGRDPLQVASRWIAEGATRLHVVDLDGARGGGAAQAGLVERLVRTVSVPCQVAGGLRDRTSLEATLDAGADRVVVGTLLLEEPDAVAACVEQLGAERFVGAIDVREGRALGDGWTDPGGGRAVHIVLEMAGGAGLRRLAVTAIERDGVLSGPDLDMLAEIRRLMPHVAIIASGGVSTLDDLRALADLGCEGAIVGRALYERRFTVAQAQAAAA
jgi:phosphoribosylformimino-5-aminoimidazole carboxamide ribotide isomerase